MSQGPLTASFGLGQEWLIDTLEVRWPSGIVQTLTGIPADLPLEIVETDCAGLPDVPVRPADFRLYPARPNPFGRATSVRYDMPEAAEVDLAVYEVSGRLVRRLVDQKKQAGRHTAYWDGKTAEGFRAAPGIYYCRFAAGYYEEIRQITLLR
jgi:hypothetical protein